MPSNISMLVKNIARAFPGLHFKQSDVFQWRHSTKTVFYRAINSHEDAAMLLHEVAHAFFHHKGFKRDMELLKYENQAWKYAQSVLAPQFDIRIEDDFLQDHLDTYRDWLYARSNCPSCTQTGLQTDEYRYECVNCQCTWKVNDARLCELRRYITS